MPTKKEMQATIDQLAAQRLRAVEDWHVLKNEQEKDADLIAALKAACEQHSADKNQAREELTRSSKAFVEGLAEMRETLDQTQHALETTEARLNTALHIRDSQQREIEALKARAAWRDTNERARPSFVPWVPDPKGASHCFLYDPGDRVQACVADLVARVFVLESVSQVKFDLLRRVTELEERMRRVEEG
jgi:hypothetical protein